MRNASHRDHGWHRQAVTLVGVLAVAVVILLTSGRAAIAADPLASMGVVTTERGKEAPDFTLPDPEEKRKGLRDFRGKVVVLTFFTTW